MVTPPDIQAQILRYYHAEKWTAGTIARQLHVHHSVVRRVLAQAGLPRIGAAKRPSPIDAYLPLIHETLGKFRWRKRGGIAGPPTPAVTWWPISGHAAPLRPICACAACRENKVKWTGGYAELGIAPTMPTIGLCRAMQEWRRGLAR